MSVSEQAESATKVGRIGNRVANRFAKRRSTRLTKWEEVSLIVGARFGSLSQRTHADGPMSQITHDSVAASRAWRAKHG